MTSSRQCCPTQCPLPPLPQEQTRIRILSTTGPEPQSVHDVPGTAYTAFPRGRKTSRCSQCPEAELPKLDHLLRSPGTSPLGNEMTHTRGQTFPLLSSSCFLNKQTEPTQTLLYSTDGSLKTQDCFQTTDCAEAPYHLLACRLFCHLPGVSRESGITCHQLQREAKSVSISGG